MESTLEKELREWRENRSRAMSAMADSRDELFSMPQSGSFARSGRRLRVNGREVVVVSKARRPLPS